MTDSRILIDLWEVVRGIPEGRVASYGEVGRALRPPVSGLLVGRWLARCPDGVPWWRVVSKEGTFPIYKKDPHDESRQIDLLTDEGVVVVNGQVSMARFGIVP